MKFPHGLRALRSRNFRMFIAGQGTSHIGNWVQMVAVSWMVYRLTGSTVMLGLSAFALHIPFFLVAPFAGVMLDRMDLRRVLFITNFVAVLQGALMLMLVATGQIQAWHLILGNLVLGIVNAFDSPARQSMLVQLVDDRADLPNAIALNSSTMNSGRFIGPMVGGSVIAAFGEAWGFAGNLLLRTAVIAALIALRVPARPARAPSRGVLSELVEGLQYVRGFLPARGALLLLACCSLTVQSYSSLMPWFASHRFQGNSATLGLLVSSAGIGAVAGMVYLAMRSSIVGLFRLIGITAAVAGASLVLFTFTATLWLGMLLICVTGMAMMLTAASTNTVVQTFVPDGLRSRVAAIYMLCFLGVSPFGALANGWVADHVGAPAALGLSGSLALLASVFYLRQLPRIRAVVGPMYRQRGLLPPDKSAGPEGS